VDSTLRQGTSRAGSLKQRMDSKTKEYKAKGSEIQKLIDQIQDQLSKGASGAQVPRPPGGKP
jgi:flagellar capping protein FliD